MRRIVIAILVFGSLGLAATVCISWWLAIDVQRSTFLNAGDYPVIWQWPGALVQRNDARPPDVRERGENLEYERMAAEFDPPYWSALRGLPDDGSRRVMEISTGWPLKTFRMVGEGRGSFTESVDMRFRGTLVGDLALSRFGRRTMPITRLPVQPIWLNLIVSVAVWAVLCGLILNVPRFLRVIRWNLRREKKRCGWCGHDPRMQRSNVCTECGHDLDTPPRWLGGPSIVGAVLLLVALLSGEAMLLVQFLSHQPIQDIHWAAAQGDVEGVRAAIADGADVDAKIEYYDWMDRTHTYDGMTPLLLAILNENGEMISLLLEVGADPNEPASYKGINTPIMVAAGDGDKALVAALLSAGADPTVEKREGVSAFRLAVERGHLDVVNLFLSSPLTSNVRPGFYDLSLERAAYEGHREVVARLLECGAKATDDVMFASMHGNWETVELLISRGGNLMTTTPHGQTLLFRGDSRDPRIWQAALDAGVNVNAVEAGTGETALHHAIWQYNGDLAEFLLKAGADPRVADSEGLTPLDVAHRLRRYRQRANEATRIQHMIAQALAARGEGSPNDG